MRDVVKPGYPGNSQTLDEFSAEAARAITGIVERRRTVNWIRNQDVQNQMKNDIDYYLYQFERRGDPNVLFQLKCDSYLLHSLEQGGDNDQRETPSLHC